MKEYIEKELLLEELDRIKTFYAGDRDKYINMIIDYVKSATSETDVIKHGYWITRFYEYEEDYVINTVRDELCSCCRQSSDEQFDYCPVCGAKMDGKEITYYGNNSNYSRTCIKCP